MNKNYETMMTVIILFQQDNVAGACRLAFCAGAAMSFGKTS